LQKCFIRIKKKFSVATLVLPFLSVLILTIIITPVSKAASSTISLDPSQGPAGSMVIVYIRGVPVPSDVTFGTTHIGTVTPWPGTSSSNLLIKIPQEPPGTYTVTATSTMGVLTATFTITQGPSPTPSETPQETPDSTPQGSDPTNPPVTTNNGFWSPLTISIISAVIAGAIFAITLYVRRGRQQTPQYQETSHYEPQFTVPSKRPNTPSKISQPTNNSQQPPYTKICRHCKQPVRDDLNVCPHCFKRLR
jgi:hypothetical protein